MSNDVSFKRADYIEVSDRWATVGDICAGQYRVVARLPCINAHDKSPENLDRNSARPELPPSAVVRLFCLVFTNPPLSGFFMKYEKESRQ
ncbi:hypothetical protein GV819_16910 [Pseudomonas sp. Fl5BN2]|nr:hypothetical protein [Pseudomonas sp. Fl5BN2]NBF03976.1 hypothetical protein [Pseudomonas sp. Fl5BN2]